MSAARRLLAEKRTQEAMEKSDLGLAPGFGQPLDISEYFDLPAADRLGYSMLKSAGALPPEVALIREVEELERTLRHSREPMEAAQLRTQIQARRTSFRQILDGGRRASSAGASLEGPLF